MACEKCGEIGTKPDHCERGRHARIPEVWVADDGTLDTVFECQECGEELRYSSEGIERDECGIVLDSERKRVEEEHADECRLSFEEEAKSAWRGCSLCDRSVEVAEGSEAHRAKYWFCYPCDYSMRMHGKPPAELLAVWAVQS